MTRRQLDILSLIFLLLGILTIMRAPMLHPQPGITVTLPEYISSAIEPDMELGDDGQPDPAFTAWAVQQLANSKTSRSK